MKKQILIPLLLSLASLCFALPDMDGKDKIGLIKKQTDYAAMNKSGKGSGPFGFDIGISLEETKAATIDGELKHIGGDRYSANPKKAHPLFEDYVVWVSDTLGLYYIKAISRSIKTSEDGTEAKKRIQQIAFRARKKIRQL